MPYQFKDNYKDLVLFQKSSKESLQSISDRKTIVANKFRLKYKSKNSEVPSKDYALRSIEHRIKKTKESVRRERKDMTKVNCSSQK